MPAIPATTISQMAIEGFISQPISPEVAAIVNRYALNVIARQPVNLQGAHDAFLTALRNDQAIPQNIRTLAEIRLNRTFFLFNQLRDNRANFDAGLQANDNNISDFLQTPVAQELNQQYRQHAEGLRRVLPEDVFRGILPYATPRPIRSVPPE